MTTVDHFHLPRQNNDFVYYKPQLRCLFEHRKSHQTLNWSAGSLSPRPAGVSPCTCMSLRHCSAGSNGHFLLPVFLPLCWCQWKPFLNKVCLVLNSFFLLILTGLKFADFYASVQSWSLSSASYLRGGKGSSSVLEEVLSGKKGPASETLSTQLVFHTYLSYHWASAETHQISSLGLSLSRWVS